LAESEEGYIARRPLHIAASGGDEKVLISSITAGIGLTSGGVIVVGYTNGHIRLVSAALHSTGIQHFSTLDSVV
jgi:hypothetical protein